MGDFGLLGFCCGMGFVGGGQGARLCAPTGYGGPAGDGLAGWLEVCLEYGLDGGFVGRVGEYPGDYFVGLGFGFGVAAAFQVVEH